MNSMQLWHLLRFDGASTSTGSSWVILVDLSKQARRRRGGAAAAVRQRKKVRQQSAKLRVKCSERKAGARGGNVRAVCISPLNS